LSIYHPIRRTDATNRDEVTVHTAAEDNPCRVVELRVFAGLQKN